MLNVGGFGRGGAAGMGVGAVGIRVNLIERVC